MDFYMTVLIKFILGLLCIILQINLVGKSNLAPVTPLDQVQNYVLGGIIGGIIYSESVTVFQFLFLMFVNVDFSSDGLTIFEKSQSFG